MVWIWTGDPAGADPGLVPDYMYHRDPGWAWSPVFLSIACDWQLLYDILLDLTHLAYVHKKTIGGDPDAHTRDAQLQTQRQGHLVQVKRWLPNSNPPPFYQGALATLLEDKHVLEAQQARVLEEPERGFVDIRWDAGPLFARRVVDELVAAEAG